MLLVRAAVLRGEAQLRDWRAWCEVAVPERMHSGEVRLLAAAYKPLVEAGEDGEMMEIAKGVYRRTWYVNHVSRARNAEIVRRLDAAGVPSLVLKGFALAVTVYRDLGARPMEDLDVLVAPERIEDAVAALEPMGLVPAGASRRPTGLLGNEVDMLGPDGRSVVELHAYGLIESADDADLWERRTAFPMGDAEAFAPGPEDHLLLVLAHGQLWNTVQPVSWAVDAAALVRAAGAAFDWDRFAGRAIARELTQPAIRGLRMLRDLGVTVPGRTLAALEAHPVGAWGRLADRAARGVPGRLAILILAADRYRRFRAAGRVAGPGEWLLRIWDAETPAGLVREAGPRLRHLARSLEEQGIR
jgi:hypothetical protein